jgi:hypothetical protein
MGMRRWFALTPALSQTWEREQDLRLPFSQNWEKRLALLGFPEGLARQDRGWGMRAKGLE